VNRNVFGPFKYAPYLWVVIDITGDVNPLKMDSIRTQLTFSIPMSSTFNPHPSESISSLNPASSSTKIGQAMAAAFVAGHSMNPIDLLKVNVILGC